MHKIERLLQTLAPNGVEFRKLGDIGEFYGGLVGKSKKSFSEIQQEIVKILDQFSILTTDLLAGIPAEIKARKKQYEYYREKLLAFKPLKA
ncbi:hypothetical protein BTM182_01790 [Helicobacter pylori]